MANVIKHKRGSGSDPVANNLVIGELAIRTDNGKLFTKMDSGAIAEIAGGGSDIAINTLSSSSATGGGSATFNGSAYRFTLSSPPSVSAAQLLVSVNGVIQKPVAGTGQPSEGFSVDGNDIIFGDAPATGADFFILTFRSLGVSEPAANSVTNAKVASNAAIAGTKISPDFGSQNIVTTGVTNLSGELRANGNIRMTNASPKITFVDDDNNPDFEIGNLNGLFRIRDATNTTNRLVIDSSGKIGIATTSPTRLLHQHESSSGANYHAFTNSTTGSAVTNGMVIGLAGTEEAIFWNYQNTAMRFATQGAERMRIDSSGNVGIGLTSSPISSNSEQGVFIGGADSTQSVISSNVTPFVINRIGTGGNDRNCIEFRNNGTLRGTIGAIGASNGIFFQSATSEAMRIDSSGRLLHGVTSAIPVCSVASSKLQVHNNASVLTASFTGYGAHSGGSIIALGKSRSSTVGDATGAVQSGDTLGDIRFGGSDGTDMQNTAAQILAKVDGSVSSNSLPGAIIFQTNNGSSLGERIRIRKEGGITFNGDTAADNALDDYEEGTFSGTASAVGYSGGSAISMSGEQYTKIGRLVFFRMHLTVASSLNDGDLTITGLPFTASKESVVNFAWQDAASFNGGQGIITGTQCVRFNGVFPTHSSGNAVIRFSGTYNV